MEIVRVCFISFHHSTLFYLGFCNQIFATHCSRDYICANIDVAWMSNQRLRFSRMLKHLCGMDTSNLYVDMWLFWCILLMVCYSIFIVILFIYFGYFFSLWIPPMLLSLLRGHSFWLFAFSFYSGCWLACCVLCFFLYTFFASHFYFYRLFVVLIYSWKEHISLYANTRQNTIYYTPSVC